MANVYPGFGINVEATGRRIDSLFRMYGITTRQISDAMHVTYQCVDKWRKGRCLPDTQNLYILSKIFGKCIDDLLVGIFQYQSDRSTIVDTDLNNVILLVERFEEYNNLHKVIGMLDRAFFVNMHIESSKICYEDSCIAIDFCGAYVDFESHLMLPSGEKVYICYFREGIKGYLKLTEGS